MRRWDQCRRRDNNLPPEKQFPNLKAKAKFLADPPASQVLISYRQSPLPRWEIRRRPLGMPLPTGPEIPEAIRRALLALLETV